MLLVQIVITVISLGYILYMTSELLDMKRTSRIFDILTTWADVDDKRWQEYDFEEMKRMVESRGFFARYMPIKDSMFPPKSPGGDSLYEFTKQQRLLLKKWKVDARFFNSLTPIERELVAAYKKHYVTSDKPVLNSIRDKWVSYMKFKSIK